MCRSKSRNDEALSYYAAPPPCSGNKTAVRKSLAERARTGQRVKQLENLRGSGGKQINDPEDEKLWLSIESKHAVVEFDYARTWEQVRHAVCRCMQYAADVEGGSLCMTV